MEEGSPSDTHTAAATIMQKHFRGRHERLYYPWFVMPNAFSLYDGMRRDGGELVDGEVIFADDPRHSDSPQQRASMVQVLEDVGQMILERNERGFRDWFAPVPADWALFISTALEYDDKRVWVPLGRLKPRSWQMVDGRVEAMWVQLRLERPAPITAQQIVLNAFRDLSIETMVTNWHNSWALGANYEKAFYCMFVVLRDIVLVEMHRFDRLPVDVINTIVHQVLGTWPQR